MAAPGWYGKLPMLGDFAHRRLPLGFVNAWDAWLSHGIAASREQLGAAWLETYLTAPLWCFTCSPRVIDDEWWFGVLMPSVDKVGRYFPLVVAFSNDHAPAEAQALPEWTQWYENAGACALGTLQGHAALEEFESALASTGTPSTLPAASAPLTSSAAVHACPASNAIAVALQSLAGDPQPKSAWWLREHTEPQPLVTVIQGLPAADRFVGLLQGAL